MLPLSKLRQVAGGFIKPYSLATSTCLHPRKLRVYNPVIGNSVEQYVPCGHCENCRQQMRDEWVTRMCLHSLSWHHCYFVTLTYGSYDLNPFIAHPFKEDWLKTFPVRDKFNSKHKFVWTPAILCQEHLSKFIKRLRKNTGAAISYCACGEYGETHSRPHFHLIIWSMQPLTVRDIRRAWSLKCVELYPGNVVLDNGLYKSGKPFDFTIGRVDFHDLVKNGSLDWDAKPKETLGAKDMSANFCFNYVAKYIRKKPDLPCIAELRMKRAFVRLPLDDSYYDNEDLLSDDFNDKIDNYRQFTKNKINYEKVNFKIFKEINSPFFVCSRKNAIGKVFALSRIESFKAGNYTLPPFCGKQLTFPSYFARLTFQALYPIRLRSIGLQGISLIKGNLPVLYSYYMELACLGSKRDFITYALQNSKDVRNSGIYRPIGTDLNRGTLLDISLVDPRRGIVKYHYDLDEDVFIGEMWDVSERCYYQCDEVTRIDFLSFILDLICKQFDSDDSKKDDRQLRLDIMDAIQNDKHTPEMIASYIAMKEENQRLYHSKHKLKCDKQ